MSLPESGIEKLEGIFKAANELIGKGDITKVVGSDADGSGGTFEDVEKRAEVMVKEDETHKLTKAQAIRKLYRDNPELYKQYEESKKGM